jgi:hypothetical protein
VVGFDESSVGHQWAAYQSTWEASKEDELRAFEQAINAFRDWEDASECLPGSLILTQRYFYLQFLFCKRCA